MNIFYTVNDAFMPQLGAAICSVCENNKDTAEIHFYIGALDVSSEHQEQLRQLTLCYHRKISFIPLNHLHEKFGFSLDTKAWNEVALARLLADKLLPKTVERILYLDGDTIVLRSLQELWETDLDDYVLGACPEPTADRKRKEILGLNDQPYYNSGVLLIDLKKWREDRTGERIIEFYIERLDDIVAPDQDAINGVLAGRIKTLSVKYNFFNVFWHYPYQTLVKIQYPVPFISEADFREACEKPCIIHFLGEDRPWRQGNTHLYSREYMNYLSQTPWKDVPMEDGWELYFKCYGAFWKVLHPFPMLQYKIMNTLIPIVLKKRVKKNHKEKSG